MCPDRGGGPRPRPRPGASFRFPAILREGLYLGGNSMSWFEPSFCYQIYPLGLCGAPYENDGVQSHRLCKLLDDGWIEHLNRLGVSCLILNPVFESLSHGYDTSDYTKVDCRLGDAEDLRLLVDACHTSGIHVLLDGVFNHVGRGFSAFRDVQEKRWEL